MEPMSDIYWGYGPGDEHVHAFIRRAATLCGKFRPSLLSTSDETPPGMRCDGCEEMIEAEKTPEARLIHAALRIPMFEASEEARKIASYVCEERSKLATELDRMAERIERLYIGPGA